MATGYSPEGHYNYTALIVMFTFFSSSHFLIFAPIIIGVYNNNNNNIRNALRHRDIPKCYILTFLKRD